MRRLGNSLAYLQRIIICGQEPETNSNRQNKVNEHKTSGQGQLHLLATYFICIQWVDTIVVRDYSSSNAITGARPLGLSRIRIYNQHFYKCNGVGLGGYAIYGDLEIKISSHLVSIFSLLPLSLLHHLYRQQQNRTEHRSRLHRSIIKSVLSALKLFVRACQLGYRSRT